MLRKKQSRVVIPTESEIESARSRSEARAAYYGRSLKYDRGIFYLALRNGLAVRIPAKMIAELATATPSQIRAVRLTPDGGTLEQCQLDVDISVPGLLRDLLGFDSQSRGGKARSAAKVAAARANGAKGGRPRKVLG